MVSTTGVPPIAAPATLVLAPEAASETSEEGEEEKEVHNGASAATTGVTTTAAPEVPAEAAPKAAPEADSVQPPAASVPITGVPEASKVLQLV